MHYFISFILRALSRLPLAALQMLGSLAGALMIALPTRRAGRVKVNIDLCFPHLDEQARRRMGRQALINLGRTTFETPRLWFGPEPAVRKALQRVENLELFEQARQIAAARHTGVLVLAPHLNWEAAVLVIGCLGPSTFCYKPQNPKVEPLVVAGRGRFGTRFVQAIPGNVRQQLQQNMEEGDTVLLLPDQDPPRGRGVFAPFFGVAAHSPSITSRLVQKTQAPVLLLQVERLGIGQGFRSCFLEAPQEISNPDTEISVAGVNRAMELCIQTRPEQYMWNVPRFRRRPPGEAKLYSV